MSCRKGGRHRHNIFSAPQQYTWKQMKKCDVWADCCVLTPPKGQSISHLYHNWRKLNQIFRVGQHNNRRSDIGKNIIQH